MSRTKKAGIFFAVMAILMIVLGVNDRDAEFLTTGIGICVVIALIAYYLQGRKKRCPSCKKLFALQKVEEKVVSEEEVYVLMNNNVRNKDGEITGTVEQRVPGIRRTFDEEFVCKHCGEHVHRTFYKDIPKI